jgi:hypothetical protein
MSEGVNPRGSPGSLMDHSVFRGSPDHEDTTTEVRECGMALECFVVSFKYLVRTSQKTPMNVADTSSTIVSTRQRNDSHCLLVIKHQKPQKTSDFQVACVSLSLQLAS